MSLPTSVPSCRVLQCNHDPVRGDGHYVLYWMTAFRRTRWNFALERAADWAEHLKKPLLVCEVLSCGGRWANDRQHAFVLDGMRYNAAECKRKAVHYYPFAERREGEARELLDALSANSCLVVGDAFPIAAPASDLSAVRVYAEAVDSNGLLPLRAAESAFSTAFAFRRHLQRTLPEHLEDMPRADGLARRKIPLLRSLPKSVGGRFQRLSEKELERPRETVRDFPIDHTVAPVDFCAGQTAAKRVLRRFIRSRLSRYDLDRNEPDKQANSGLSPYLHHGHISVHEVFHAVARHEQWSPTRLSEKPSGHRAGFWGMSEPAEAFLDQLVTWRELGFNTCHVEPDHFDRFDALPQWALATLKKHSRDRRPYVYSFQELENARTHDPLWNAAQTQLLREGALHNYLRMLWGKKILEWTASPEEALSIMIELNNKYALDGSDPASYCGITWVLGRYDRPWGPERPIFGTVRYMSSSNTARKVRVKDYLRRYSAPESE